MRHEGASHVVVLHFPQAAHLGEFASAVAEELELGRHEGAGGHPGILEHTRNVGLQDLVALGDNLVHGEFVALARGGILVDEHALDGILLLVGNPAEVGGEFLEQAERDRVIRNTLRYEESDIYKQLAPLFGGAPHFPSGYKIRKASESFAWIADDKQVYQDVFLYRYPVEDNPFTLDKMIAHRNQILQENVPGMLDGSYMTTSGYFKPTLEYLKYKGREVAQIRGMWEVQNDFMGGPFVSHSFYSADGKEILVAEAWVYAPQADKRQYLRQVESVLYSWEWKKADPEEENAAN